MRRITRSLDCVGDPGHPCRSNSERPTAADQPPLGAELSCADGERRLERIALGNLELRPDECDAILDGRRVGLTVREFQLLYVLAQHADRVVRRAEIYTRVWGGEMKYRERAVDVLVRKLRNKLSTAAPGWLYIHTHVGVGYRFSPAPLDPGVKLSSTR